MIYRNVAINLAGLVALTLGTQAVAQETKTLKFAHVFSATHFHWVDGGKIFTEEVTKASGGKIQFEVYHGGQLGKEGGAVLKSGLADIAVVVTGYEPSRFPLTTVAELPGLYKSSCEGTAKLWNITKDDGPLSNAEYKPQGFHPLYSVVLTPYQVMTNAKTVSTLPDLTGLKIRANGAAMDKTVRLLGGTPVLVTAPEIYDSLSRGTIDGAMWPIGQVRPIGLEKVLRHTIDNTLLGGGSNVIGIRQKVWDSLSAEEKDIFAKAADKTWRHLCKYLDDLDASETTALLKDYGLNVVHLPDAELAKWNERVAPVATDWAKEMDSTGRPGSALLKAFKEAPAN